MFVQTEHVFDPSSYSDEELFYNIEKDIIPVAIQCVALEGVDGNFNILEKLIRLRRKVDKFFHQVYCFQCCNAPSKFYSTPPPLPRHHL